MKPHPAARELQDSIDRMRAELGPDELLSALYDVAVVAQDAYDKELDTKKEDER